MGRRIAGRGASLEAASLYEGYSVPAAESFGIHPPFGPGLGICVLLSLDGVQRRQLVESHGRARYGETPRSSPSNMRGGMPCLFAHVMGVRHPGARASTSLTPSAVVLLLCLSGRWTSMCSNHAWTTQRAVRDAARNMAAWASA